MKKIVAITGAGGFIGSRLVAGLVQRGWHVYAITSRPENVPLAPEITPVGCNWTAEGIREAFTRARNAALWIHTAARVDFSDGDLLTLYHDNALLTERLAHQMASSDRRIRLVYLSSISVYGHGQELSVDVEPRPGNHYGLSKFLGERLSLACLGKRCLVLRLAGVWGSEEKSKLFVNQCLRQARTGARLTVKGSGQGQRNYLWAGDIPGIVALAYAEGWHGVRLAAGAEPISIREMVTAIAGRFGVPVSFEATDATQPESDIIVRGSGLPTTDFKDALGIETGVR